jgi:hypothetical protein
MSYYVRIATRGSAKTGSPRQALNYITDAHDIRRDTSYSDAELHYIARMDSGWKTDLEGGRVPLVGFGELAGELDEKAMAARFEESCLPYHSIRGTTGYKSITLTVPKEVSLYAEGHREEAKVAINAAIKQALDRAFGGFSYSAVAAIHTRNQAGEIHYHAHVLVGKFARAIETGRMVSLNSSTTGKNTPSRLREMKAGWQEGIEKEFRERLQLGIEQKTSRSPVALVLPDGTRLEPLNRESRRVLEKELCPTFTETSDDGHALMRHFRWSAMDDRIFEIASGARGTSAWDVAAFKEAFPDQARFVARYEARVLTLQSIGYLSPGGTINSAFRVHFAAHHGVLTPELQRVRIDLMHRLGKETNDKNARGNAGPLHPDQFWTQVQKYADLRHRIERLPELSLYTGVFVTGGVGSGKTSAVAYPALRQLLGFRREVAIRRRSDASLRKAAWTFSGLVMDEKGDFTRAATQYAEDWGRADDIIRIVPGGKWIWNVIYNPNLPTWAVAYQLGCIIKNFNKGFTGNDPFWENAPKELTTDFLGLLDDAKGYYTLFDYLETLVDDTFQDALNAQAMARHARNSEKVEEIERRWKSITKRRDGMSVNLRGSLEACARAGIEMFRFPELRRTFCPTKEEYFERDSSSNLLRPRANVFTGFD